MKELVNLYSTYTVHCNSRTRLSNALYCMGTLSRSSWNLEVLTIVEGRGNLGEYLERNHLEQGQEPTKNSTHI